MKLLKKNKKGDLELDELGKIILGVIFLVVLIVIITVAIRGELFSQGEKIKDIFNFF